MAPIIPQNYQSRRFDLPDVHGAGRWLVPRLAEAWPHWQQAAIHGWLRSIIGSNEYNFVRTDHAVALASIVHEKISPAPIVKEIFVVHEDLPQPRTPNPTAEEVENIKSTHEQYLMEATSLYDDLFRWTFNVGASEFQSAAPRVFADVPHDVLSEKMRISFGKCYERSYFIAYTKPK
jgi:hypothetical protein